MTPNEPGLRERRVPGLLRAVLLSLVLAGAILLTYQPVWSAGFIWDDDQYVTHNPLLTAPDGLRRIWFSTDSPSQYFPLVYSHFRVQRALWDLDPAGYHWTNLFLHVANALLVWRLLARLLIPGAWLGAAFFALHPLQVESVAWITELKNLQSLFFSLLALLAWERFAAENRPASRGGGGRRLLLYAGALACHALALFSKTTACTLPAALVLVLWWRRQSVDGRRWLQVLPFVLQGLAMGLVSVWWERHHQGVTGPEFAYSAVERVLIAARALCFYLGSVVWPDNLSFSYPLWQIDAGSPAAWAWFLPLVLVIGVLLAARRRCGRGPEAALAYFAASLLPLLGFFMLYTFRYTFVADHYVYAALIGPAALAGAALAVVGRRLRTAPAPVVPLLCAGLLAGLAMLSWRQSHMYRDLRTLWQTTVERTPTSFMAHNNLGAQQLQAGQVDLAIDSFERALALKPGHTHALANLANARLVQGRTEESLRLFRRVLELAPDDAKAQADYGQVLERTGAASEAETHFRRAVALDGRLAEGHFLLGRCLVAAGRGAEAEPSLLRAIELHAGYADAHYHLGLVRLSQQRAPEAAECFRRTLEHAPEHTSALNNLGLLLTLAGGPAEAEPLQRRAAQLQPANPALHHSLARTLLALRRRDEAVAEFQAALRLAPDAAAVRLELAQAQIEGGRYAEAAATLEAHLARHPADFEARHGLGRVLAAAGRSAEAMVALRAVLVAVPDHPEAREDLERLIAAQR